MKKESLHEDLLNAVQTLLQMARDASFNTISDNCSYILSEIKNDYTNFSNQNNIRKTENDKKTPKPLTEISVELERIFSNLYDVNLLVYRAYKHSTLIEISYFPRSSLDADYQQITATQETMLHCKVALPAYLSEKREQFDINWEHGTINHKWKMFWWRRKMKKSARRREHSIRKV